MQSLPLPNRYKLSDETVRKIFPEIIRRFITEKNISSVKSPVAILLGGQPGAGKTSLQKIAETELNNNVVLCNADDLRSLHPMAKEIMTKYPEQYFDITNEYAQRWKKDLAEYCLNNNYNLINETTFSSNEGINQSMRNYKNHHFKVEIMLMAVDKPISRISTMLRYEENRSLAGHARMVSKAGHDDRFNNLPATIRVAEKEKLYDLLRIYARGISVAGSTDNEGVVILAKNPGKVEQCLNQFYNRIKPEKLKNFFTNKCNEVLTLLKKRNATEKEIAQFKAEREELKKEMGIMTIAQKKDKGLTM